MNKSIPKEFCHINYPAVVCKTVGEAIEQLQRLPKDLRIEEGFGEGVQLVVANVSTDDPYLYFEEVEDES